MHLGDFFSQLGRPVGYYPSMAIFLGSVKAAIFLCQLGYWEGKQSDPGGWIYKTQEEITLETGLSRREQEGARKLLKKKGYLHEKFAGLPRKLYFRVDWNKVSKYWQIYMKNRECYHNAQNCHTGLVVSCLNIFLKWPFLPYIDYIHRLLHRIHTQITHIDYIIRRVCVKRCVFFKKLYSPYKSIKFSRRKPHSFYLLWAASGIKQASCLLLTALILTLSKSSEGF
ncbi:MAG: hypothetical protein LWW94_10975 [Candidatus Desulfofervidaceae bacterium]|nr:hypothetical protein [Candidatus Desulfofervidaceae bacterium]